MFLLASPLLGPLPTRSSRGEEGALDAALTAPGSRTFRWILDGPPDGSVGGVRTASGRVIKGLDDFTSAGSTSAVRASRTRIKA